MTMLQNQTSLLERIAQLRQRLRLMLGLHAVGLVVSAVLWLVLLLTFADYLLHFPGILRLVLLLLAATAVVALAVRQVLRIRRPIPDSLLASRVEISASMTEDEILSAVDFLKRRELRGNAMAGQAIAAAENSARQLNFAGALNWKPVWKMGMIALVELAAIVLIAIAVPAGARLAMLRWTDPLGHHPWPLKTHVHLYWTNSGPPRIWPRGDALTVAAKVTKGFSPHLRVWLELRQNGRRLPAVMMVWQGKSHGNLFEAVILPHGHQLTLRAVAGDDSNEPPTTIRIVPRPTFVSLQAIIMPPAYAAGIPPTVIDLFSHRAQAIVGSHVTLSFRGDEPLAAKPSFILANPLTGKPLSGLNATEKNIGPHRGELSFIASTSFNARLIMTDADSMQNRRGGLVNIQVIPDALPQVRITRPRHSVEASPDAVIHLQIRATDDLGLKSVYLAGGRVDAPAKAAPLFRFPLSWRKVNYDPATRSVNGVAEFQWKLASLALKPGDAISIFAQVRDNYSRRLANGKTLVHPLVRSRRLLISIRSRADIERELRADLRQVRQALAALLRRQQETAAQTKSIQQAIGAAGKTTPAQQQALAALGQKQASEAQRAASIARTLAGIARIAKRNNLETSAPGKLAALAASLMKPVGARTMPHAADRLDKAAQAAQKPSGAAHAQADAGRAFGHQQNAISVMQKLLARLGAAGQFASLEAKTLHLLHQQQKLEQELKNLAKQTLGQNPDQLPAKLKAQAAALAAQQRNLAGKMDQLSRQLNKAAQQTAAKNPGMSKALAQAAQLAQKYSISDAMRLAGRNAALNRMQAAAGNQGQAAKGLKKMLSALQKEQGRSLQSRINRLKALIALVKQLIKRQRATEVNTGHAAPDASAAALAPLANDESRLQLDTLNVAHKAARSVHTGEAPAWLHGAADMMGKATGWLIHPHQPLAVQRQVIALADLKHALKELQKALKNAQNKKQLQQLAGIKKEYQHILKIQSALQSSAVAIRQRKQARGMIMRPDMLQLQADGQVQVHLIHLLDGLSVKLADKAPVIVWMNRRIAGNMKLASQTFGTAQATADLIAEQNAAIMGLKDIINSLKEQMHVDQHGGGGGGGGGGGKPPLIPPVAQLKLLRIVQNQVNAATVQLHAMQKADPVHKQAVGKQIKQLGHIQRQIRQQVINMIKAMQAAQAGGHE